MYSRYVFVVVVLLLGLSCSSPRATLSHTLPESIELFTQVNSTATESFILNNTGDLALNYQLNQDATWLSLSPASGELMPSQETKITLRATCFTLANVETTLVLTSNDPEQETLSTKVVLKCQEPQADISLPEPTSLSLSGLANSSVSSSFSLSNLGTESLSYTLNSNESWLKVQPSTGNLARGQSQSFLVEARCPDAGSYEANVDIMSNDPDTPQQTLAVTLSCQLNGDAAHWQASPTMLDFTGTVNEAAPNAQSFSLSNIGNKTGNYSLTVDQAWLKLQQTTGSLEANAQTTISVSVEACTVAGTESGLLSLSGEGQTTNVLIERNCQIAAGLDLSFDRLYINQAVPAADSKQNAEDQVALVAGRTGLLRAFVTANETNTLSPEVRLFYRQGSKMGSLALSGPSGVPLNISESNLTQTFNTVLSDLIQPDLEIYLEVDPNNTIAESNENNNRYPESGYLRLDVKTLPRLNVTLVPVNYQGTLPEITESNKQDYLATTLNMHPVDEVDITIHSPYSFSGNLSTSQGWSSLLEELTTLRSSEGSQRLYYGVVNPGYTQGIAGIGWIGFPVSVGWSRLPSAADVAAHEIGHNWDQNHAPCGGAGGSDANYPYSGASIGTWGYNASKQRLVNPNTHKDIMSYCDPAWISDYTYDKVLNFRQRAGGFLRTQNIGHALVVSGSIENAKVALNPSFHLPVSAQLPETGPYTLKGFSADGELLFSVPFRSYHVADILAPEAFHFSLPLSLSEAQSLSRLNISLNGKLVTEKHLKPSPGLKLQSLPFIEKQPNGFNLRWDTTHYEALLLKTPQGEVIAQDTTGAVQFNSQSKDIELVFSDGLRSYKQKLKLP